MKLKNPLILTLLLILSGLFVYLFIFSAEEKEKLTEDDYRKAFQHHYKIFAAKVPAQISFAGEEVPVDRFDVRESLDRELTVNSYWHSNTQLMFKRAFRYFPVIDSILEKNNIPKDFRYLAMIESGLQNVVSPAGATGIWQIMKGTGRDYGLEINNQVDERYHLAKATEAACKYLRKAKDKFGTWTMAAAAYNMGRAATSRRIMEQKTESYYDMYLNRETARYVYRILAVKTIYESPTEYGFYFRKEDFYPPLNTYETRVDSSNIDLVEFAQQQEIPYKILKLLNPWLRSDKLSNSAGKTYAIKLPKENGLNYSTIMTPYKDDQQVFNDTLLIKQIYQ
ncbi:MAG: lytic transglycosylase domain-containing protein [Bacteroidales bacterium]|nr:lytic transglycosylase domain-containing protein [Bacteroidales bacterium]MCF8328268.1 lytic transglycosylase domain-containing protein [Bacteroidales bacterium]